jgi:O-antigen ligase
MAAPFSVSATKFYLFFLLVFIPAFFIPVLIDDTLYPRYLLWSALSFIFLLLNFNAYRALSELLSDKLFKILLVFFVWTLVTSLLANSIAESLTGFCKIFLLLFSVSTFVLLQNREPHFFDMVTKMLVVIALLLGMVMLYEILSEKINFSDYISLIKITSLNGNKNLFAEYMLMLLPFCLVGYARNTVAWKYISLLSVLFALFAIVFLQSRSVWVTGIVLMLLYLLLRNKLSEKSVTKFSYKFLTKAGLVIAAMVFAFLLFNAGVRQSLTKRLVSIVELNKNGSAKGRLVLWEKTLQLVKENPVIGVGSGNWKIEFQQFGQEDFISVFNVRPMNDYVLMLAETGMPGIAFYITLLLLCFYYLFKLTRIEINQQKQLNHFAVWCSLTAFMFVSFFSYTNERSENLILLSLSIGYAIANNKNLTKADAKVAVGNRGKFIPVSVSVLLFFCILFFAMKVRGEYFNYKIQLARKYENHPEVITFANKALSVFYKTDENGTPVNWYSGVSKFILQDSTALIDFENAYKANPYHIHVLNNLATATDHAGNKEKAITLYEKAIAINPNFNDAILNLTIVYLNQNNFEEADKTITKWHGRKTENYYYIKKLIDEKLAQEKLTVKK